MQQNSDAVSIDEAIAALFPEAVESVGGILCPPGSEPFPPSCNTPTPFCNTPAPSCKTPAPSCNTLSSSCNDERSNVKCNGCSTVSALPWTLPGSSGSISAAPHHPAYPYDHTVTVQRALIQSHVSYPHAIGFDEPAKSWTTAGHSPPLHYLDGLTWSHTSMGEVQEACPMAVSLRPQAPFPSEGETATHAELDETSNSRLTSSALAAHRPSGTTRNAGSNPDAGSPSEKPRMMWTREEHTKFVEALQKYNIDTRRQEDGEGKMFVGLGPHVANLIAMDIGTRTVAQVRSHAQKYFQSISKKQKQATRDSSLHIVSLGKRKTSIFDEKS